jgi:hypothetical protein
MREEFCENSGMIGKFEKILAILTVTGCTAGAWLMNWYNEFSVRQLDRNAKALYEKAEVAVKDQLEVIAFIESYWIWYYAVAIVGLILLLVWQKRIFWGVVILGCLFSIGPMIAKGSIRSMGVFQVMGKEFRNLK